MNNMNINSAIADTLDIGNTDTEKKTGLIGFYNYTVVLTYIGMWIGFLGAVSYTHLTLPTINLRCRSRWSPYH